MKTNNESNPSIGTIMTEKVRSRIQEDQKRLARLETEMIEVLPGCKEVFKPVEDNLDNGV